MASENILKQKQSVVKEIEEALQKFGTVVFFKYHGLSVADLSSLRKELKKDDSEVKIYKNTLTKRALENININLDEFMEGPNAIMFGKDVISSIKTLSKFSKENEALEIRVGIIDGNVVNLDVINEYASIPSYEGLLTMFAGGLLEHVRNLAIGFDLIAKQKEESN